MPVTGGYARFSPVDHFYDRHSLRMVDHIELSDFCNRRFREPAWMVRALKPGFRDGYSYELLNG